MGKEATRSTEVWTPTPVWPTRRTKCPVAKRPLRLPPASSSLQPPGPLSGSDLPTAGGSGGFRAFKQAPYYGRVTSAKSSGGRDDAWPSPHNGGKCPRSAFTHVFLWADVHGPLMTPRPRVDRGSAMDRSSTPAIRPASKSVSYTHLTLPTIY